MHETPILRMRPPVKPPSSKRELELVGPQFCLTLGEAKCDPFPFAENVINSLGIHECAFWRVCPQRVKRPRTNTQMQGSEHEAFRVIRRCCVKNDGEKPFYQDMELCSALVQMLYLAVSFTNEDLEVQRTHKRTKEVKALVRWI